MGPRARPSLAVLHVERQLVAGIHADEVGAVEQQNQACLLAPCREAKHILDARVRELAKRPKCRDASEIKALVRKTDDMTCMRAPIEPLSPKSLEVQALLKPLRSTSDPAKPSWPARWKDSQPLHDPQKKLKDAQKLARDRAFALDEYARWHHIKRRQARREKQSTDEFIQSRDARAEHRKRVSAARFREWSARKEMMEAESLVSASSTQRILSQRLKVRWLKARKQLVLVLREGREGYCPPTSDLADRLPKSEHEGDARAAGASSKEIKGAHLAQAYAALTPSERALGLVRVALAQEMCSLKVKFDTLDTCKDGMLSLDELSCLLGSLVPEMDAADVSTLFSDLDVDGSGALSYFELERAVREISPQICHMLREHAAWQIRVRRSTQAAYYRDFCAKLPRRVYARLQQPDVFRSFRTWKMALHDGLQPHAIKGLVDHLLTVKLGMEKLYETMREDKKRFIHIFTEIDASGDGTIDASELQGILCSLGMTCVTLADALAIIRRIDRNASDSLEYAELTRALKAFGRHHSNRVDCGDPSKNRPCHEAAKKVRRQQAPESCDISELDPSMRRPSTRELDDLDKELSTAIEQIHHETVRTPKKQCTKVRSLKTLKRLKQSPLGQRRSRKHAQAHASTLPAQVQGAQPGPGPMPVHCFLQKQVSVIDLAFGEGGVFYEHMDAPSASEPDSKLKVVHLAWDDAKNIVYDGVDPPGSDMASAPHGDAHNLGDQYKVADVETKRKAVEELAKVQTREKAAEEMADVDASKSQETVERHASKESEREKRKKNRVEDMAGVDASKSQQPVERHASKESEREKRKKNRVEDMAGVDASKSQEIVERHAGSHAEHLKKTKDRVGEMADLDARESQQPVERHASEESEREKRKKNRVEELAIVDAQNSHDSDQSHASKHAERSKKAKKRVEEMADIDARKSQQTVERHARKEREREKRKKDRVEEMANVDARNSQQPVERHASTEREREKKSSKSKGATNVKETENYNASKRNEREKSEHARRQVDREVTRHSKEEAHTQKEDTVVRSDEHKHSGSKEQKRTPTTSTKERAHSHKTHRHARNPTAQSTAGEQPR